MKKENKYNYIVYGKFFMYVFEITIIALFVSLSIILRYELYFFPNIELVSFVMMFSMLIFNLRISLLIINSCCLMQFILFGFADLPYFYIFNLYGLITFLSKKLIFKFWWFFPFFMFIFGILFGFLYSLQQFVLYGFNFAFSYWLTGIPFDILHATGNCIFALIFYFPMIKLFTILSHSKEFLFNNIFLLNIIEDIQKKEENINKKSKK